MAKPAAKSIPAASEAAARAKSKKKLMVVALSALGLLIVIGVAGWYFFAKSGSHSESARAHTEVVPRFVKLDTFTINLRHGDGEEERVLQTLINLEVRDVELEEKIKLFMPKIYNNILILLSKKRASELSTAEGKQQLAREIKTEVEVALGLRAAPVSSPPKPAMQEGNVTPGTEGAPQTDPAPAAPAPVAARDDQSGIVDVLFTSFIIQ